MEVELNGTIKLMNLMVPSTARILRAVYVQPLNNSDWSIKDAIDSCVLARWPITTIDPSASWPIKGRGGHDNETCTNRKQCYFGQIGMFKFP